MLKKMALLMVGVLTLSTLCNSGYPEKKAPQQILFEGRVIEVKEGRNFFRSLGLNVSYISATGRSVIGKDDFEKILITLRNKEHPLVRLLSYGTATTLSGQMVRVQDIAPINTYLIKDGKVIPGEKSLGAIFEFCSVIGQASIITADIHASYSRLVGWEEVAGISQKRPIISTSDVKTSLYFKSGDTIVLGGSSYKNVEKKKDEGQILFLVTIKIQEVGQ